MISTFCITPGEKNLANCLR